MNSGTTSVQLDQPGLVIVGACVGGGFSRS